MSVPSVPLRVSLALVPTICLPSSGQRPCEVGGALSLTVKLRVAGVGSVLPAGSVAATEKLCGPSGAPLMKACSQEDSLTPSAMQVNVEPASFEDQPKCGSSPL